MTKLSKDATRCVVGLAALLASTLADAAWDFSPTATEWASWSQACRVQYSWVNTGFDYEYADKYPPAEVAYWRTALGDKTFIGLHHYCGAIHYLNRAKLSSDKAMKNFQLNWAMENALYSYVRSDVQSSIYPQIAITVAQIRMEKGETDKAIQALQPAIDAQPGNPDTYGMLAYIYRRQGKLESARSTLLKADSATGGASAEVQYNLGLINLELGNADAAFDNAKKAYSLGYPLPGLRNKLAKLGKTVP